MVALQQVSVKKRQDCHVAIAPRNDITKTVFVIASKENQSHADAGSPRIADSFISVLTCLSNSVRFKEFKS